MGIMEPSAADTQIILVEIFLSGAVKTCVICFFFFRDVALDL